MKRENGLFFVEDVLLSFVLRESMLPGRFLYLSFPALFFHGALQRPFIVSCVPFLVAEWIVQPSL